MHFHCGLYVTLASPLTLEVVHEFRINLHATDSLNTGHLIHFWGDVGCVHVSISDEAKQVWHLIYYLVANTQMHLFKIQTY